MLKIHVEVFIASKLLDSEQETFTTDDLKNRVKLEFQDERPGVATHISAHCVANAPLNVSPGYNYLWRIDHDEYRVFQPHKDTSDSERISSPVQPKTEDVPEKYQYLLQDS